MKLKLFKIFIFIFLFLTLFSQKGYSDTIYYINYSKVLNTSQAGKGAQKVLKDKLNKASKKYQKLEGDFRNKEKELIAKKKIITKDEYQKKVVELRKQFSSLQQDKKKSLDEIARMRAESKNQLLKAPYGAIPKMIEALKPILEKYMKDNKIRLVLDKKNIIIGDSSLDLTDKIIELLNKEIKSLKIG